MGIYPVGWQDNFGKAAVLASVGNLVVDILSGIRVDGWPVNWAYWQWPYLPHISFQLAGPGYYFTSISLVKI